MKWYVLENGFITDQANAEAEEWTENEIFCQLFYLLIDLEEVSFFNISFTADDRALTAYDGKYHARLENGRELETYFYNLKGFNIKKLVAAYNKSFI